MTGFQIILSFLEIVGVIAFSISGAMVAIDEKLDLFGVIFLGILTSMGGGIIRDILIGVLPPHMFENYRCIVTSIITSSVVFIIAYITREYYKEHAAFIDNLNNFFDAVGLGVFTVTGIQIAISSGVGYNRFLLVFLGMLTGVGGGLIRDIVVSRKPMIFSKHIYAVASIIGGCCYLICIYEHMAEMEAIMIAILVIFIIRILATVFKWNLPKIP